jgi:hypothetical protein
MMLPLLRKARKAVREVGFSGFVDRTAVYLYRRLVRPLLPSVERLRYNDVEITHTRKLLDRVLPERYAPHVTEHLQEYEGALTGAIAEQVRPGDRVVIVGGGVGVTAVHAARRVGPEGSVICFEGGAEYARHVGEAARRNGVADRVEVRHAIVARSISVRGAEPAGSVLPPSDLPECDVLELDCEGAEVDILSHMSIRPRAVLVETHGLFGASTERVQDLLEQRGYAVEHRGVAETWLADYCQQMDIHVLVATRASDDRRVTIDE